MSGHYNDPPGRGSRSDEHDHPYSSSSRSSYPYLPSYYGSSSPSYPGTQTAPANYAPWLARPTSSSRTTSTTTAATAKPALPPTPYTSSYRPTSLPSREQVHHYLVSRRKIPQGLQTQWKIDGVPMDAYALFAAVLRAGGSNEVTKRAGWPTVAEDLGFKSTAEYPGPPEMLQRFFTKTLKELEDMWEETKRVQAANDAAAGAGGAGSSHRSHTQRDGALGYTVRDVVSQSESGTSAAAAPAETGPARHRYDPASATSSGWSSAPISPDVLPATLNSYPPASQSQGGSNRLAHPAPAYPSSSANVSGRLQTQGNKSVSPMLPPISALDYAEKTSSYAPQPSGQSANNGNTFSSVYPPDLHVASQPDSQWSRASGSSSYDQFSYTPDVTPPQTALSNPQSLSHQHSAQATTSRPAAPMHPGSARNGEQGVPAAPVKKPRKPRQPKPPADPNAPPKKRGRPRKTAPAPEGPPANQALPSASAQQNNLPRTVGQTASLSHDQPSASLSAGQRSSDNPPVPNSVRTAPAPAPSAIRLPTSINPAALHLSPQTQASATKRPEAPRPAAPVSQQRPNPPAAPARAQGAPSVRPPAASSSVAKSARPAQSTSTQQATTSARPSPAQARSASNPIRPSNNILSPFSGPPPTSGGLASVIHEAIRSEISSYTAPKVGTFQQLVNSDALPLPKTSSSEPPTGDKIYQYSKRCHEILSAVKASARQVPGVKVSLDELIFWSKLLAILKANPTVMIPGLPDRPPAAAQNSTKRQPVAGPSQPAGAASTSAASVGSTSQQAGTSAAPASAPAATAPPAKPKQKKSNPDYLRDTDGNPILDEDGHMIFLPPAPKRRGGVVMDENGNPVLGEDGQPIRKKIGRPPSYHKYVCGPDGLPIRDQYGETFMLKRVFHLPDGSVAFHKGLPIRKKKGPQPIPVFDGNGKIVLDQKGFVFHRPYETFLPKLDEEGHVIRDAKGIPLAANPRPPADWSFHTIETPPAQPSQKRARFASHSDTFIDDGMAAGDYPATLAAAMSSNSPGPSAIPPDRPGASRAEVIVNVARARWDKHLASQVQGTSSGPRPHGQAGKPTNIPPSSNSLHSLIGFASPKKTISLSGSQSTQQTPPNNATRRKDKGKARASGSTLVDALSMHADQPSTPVTRQRRSTQTEAQAPATVPRVTRSTAVPEPSPVLARSLKRARADSSPRASRSIPSVAHALLTRSSSRSLPRVLRRLSAPARPIAPLPSPKTRPPASRSALTSTPASRSGAPSSGPSRLRTSHTRPARDASIELVSNADSSPGPSKQRQVPYVELHSPRKRIKSEVDSSSYSTPEPSGPIDRARVVLTIGRKKRAKLIQQGFYDAFRDDDSDAETYIRRPGGLRAIKVPLPKGDAARWARPSDPEPIPQRFLTRPGPAMIEPWRTILDPKTILKRAHPSQCRWKGCDASLASEWQLARHVEAQDHASQGQFHGGMYGETALWRCHWRDCDKPCFHSLADLKQHMTARHISRVLYCPFADCDLSSPNISHLARHVMKTHDLPSDEPVPFADLSRPAAPHFEPLPELAGELRVDELATPPVPGTTYRTAHRIEWCRQKVQHGSMAGPDPVIHFEHPPRMLDVVDTDMEAPPSDSDVSLADSDDELYTDDPRALDRTLGRKRRWEPVVLVLPNRRPRSTAAPLLAPPEALPVPDVIEVLDSSPEAEATKDNIGGEPKLSLRADGPVESVLVAPTDLTVAAGPDERLQAVEDMQGEVDALFMAAAEDIGQELENEGEEAIDTTEWDDSAFDTQDLEEELSINDVSWSGLAGSGAERGEESDDRRDDEDDDDEEEDNVHSQAPNGDEEVNGPVVGSSDGSGPSAQQSTIDALDALDTETPADITPPPPEEDRPGELVQLGEELDKVAEGNDPAPDELEVEVPISAALDVATLRDDIDVDASEQNGDIRSDQDEDEDDDDDNDEDDLDDLPELEEVPPTPWPM